MRLSLPIPTLLLSALGTVSAAESSYNCTPGQSCWPTATEWQAFNMTIGGRLVKTIPWAAPCYLTSGHYNMAKCSEIADKYTTGLERAGVYGATEQVQYETCGNTGCLLQSIAPGLPPLGQRCELGSLSAYHVDVREPSHIAETIKFAKAHNIRLSIKNTGHDYLGRSTAPNTLAIWTHNLQTLKYHRTFTGKNCPSGRREHIGEMGAGVMARDAYDFFEGYDMNVAGGNAASVGLAGGFGQGGGHGVFTPTYGLMVDQAVEFDVVTADGRILTINECKEPDLFWAMRGGGGGTYAVLTAYRFQLYPAIPIHMHHFKATFSLVGSYISNSITRALITAHVTNQTIWSDNSITGRFYYGGNFVEFHTILPYNDDGSKFKSLTESWLQGIRAIRGLRITLDEYNTYQKYSDYNAVAQEGAARLTPNGFAGHVSSRLVPRDLFEPKSIPDLINATLTGIETNRALTMVINGSPALEVLMTTPVHTADTEGKTSANPAWRSALWHAVYLGGWTKGTSIASQQETIARINEAAEPLRGLTPGGGSYQNEDSILVEDWKSTFFGSYYDRLLEIKNRYDPTHVFDCYKCVGWREANE
ncbi:FAD binding domain-containing protein [Aspergillus carlsbadensis]|nr:FAD binding domain-containing protein [Aspergillus carlsbadensis]